jgi:hypothetical protein
MRLITLILTTILGCIGCQRQLEYTPEQPQEVHILLSNNSNTTYNSSLLENVWLFTINSSGHVSQSLEGTLSEDKSSFSAHVHKSKDSDDAEKYRFVVVANANNNIKDKSFKGKTYNELRDALHFKSTDTYSGLWGESDMIEVKKGITPAIDLLRSYGAVTIGIGSRLGNTNIWDGNKILSDGNAETEKIPFRIVKVYAMRAQNKYSIIPNEGVYNSLTKKVENPSPAGTVIKEQMHEMTVQQQTNNGMYIQLSEAQLKGAEPHDQFALVIGGYYNSSTKITYYRIDLKRDNNDQLDLLRNHIYHISIKDVKHAGKETAEEAYLHKSVDSSIDITWDLSDIEVDFELSSMEISGTKFVMDWFALGKSFECKDLTYKSTANTELLVGDKWISMENVQNLRLCPWLTANVIGTAKEGIIALTYNIYKKENGEPYKLKLRNNAITKTVKVIYDNGLFSSSFLDENIGQNERNAWAPNGLHLSKYGHISQAPVHPTTPGSAIWGDDVLLKWKDENQLTEGVETTTNILDTKYNFGIGNIYHINKSNIVHSPAVYCQELGIYWHVPSIKELMFIADNNNALGPSYALKTDKSGYWSSSINSAGLSWATQTNNIIPQATSYNSQQAVRCINHNEPYINDSQYQRDKDENGKAKRANSYIIPVEKDISHKLSIERIDDYWGSSDQYFGGNTPTNTIENNPNLKIKVVWADFDYYDKIIPTVDAKDKSMLIKVRSISPSGGNMVVAVTNQDGAILWSWHLWFSDIDPNYYSEGLIQAGTKLMDRNLGAKAKAREGNAGELFGMLYQWGRKDPFPAGCRESPYSSTLVEQTIYTPEGIKNSTSNKDAVWYNIKDNGSIKLSIANPSAFYCSETTKNNGDWIVNNLGVNQNYRWKASGKEKTIYDPCPYGWRVPDYQYWTGYPYISENHIHQYWVSLQEYGNNEMKIGGIWNNSNTDVYMPAVGIRYQKDAKLIDQNDYGRYWCGQIGDDGIKPYLFDFTAKRMETHNRLERSHACSVRPIRD